MLLRQKKSQNTKIKKSAIRLIVDFGIE